MVVLPVGELKPAETQTGLARVQCGKQAGLLGDDHIPLQPRLKPAPRVGQRVLYGVFGLVMQVVEAGIELVDELLFITEFHG